MMNRVKDFFKTNKLMKLGSLIIAFVIWIMVVNISNPEMKVTVVSDIEIDYEESLTNLDKYYSLDTQSSKVSFNVRTNERNKINSSDFKVYVDMRDYSITGALPVYVTVSDRVKDLVSDVEVSPVVVHATTEDMQEKSFDLTANIKGEPASGYAVAPASYTPSRVVLYGPNSEIGKISRIGFNIDVTNAADSVWGTAEFVYYDANDNPINADVRIVVKNSVSYFAPIYKKKTVSISVQTSGDPAPGYSLDSVNVEPNFIEIYGEDKLLQEVNAIILPSSLLNVSNATHDVNSSIDISQYLPEGLYTDTVSNVALVARISKMTIVAPVLGDPNDATKKHPQHPDQENEGSTEITEAEKEEVTENTSENMTENVTENVSHLSAEKQEETSGLSQEEKATGTAEETEDKTVEENDKLGKDTEEKED